MPSPGTTPLRGPGRVPGFAAPLTCALVLACGGSPAGRLDVGPVEFSAPGALTPNLALADGRPLLSYLTPVPAGHALRVAIRSDSGWVPAGELVAHDSLFVNWADFPSVTPLGTGAWVAHWLEKTSPAAYSYHVRMAVSADAGRTWSTPFTPHSDRSSTEHGFVAVTPWRDGAAALWLDGRKTVRGPGDVGHGDEAGPMTLRFTTLGADGMPGVDQEIDGRVCDCCQTALAVTARGLLAVYRDRTDDEVRDIVAARWEEGAWRPASPVATDGWHYPGCPVNGPSVSARGDSVVVAWFTAAAERPRVRVAFSSDGGASFGPPVDVQAGRPAGRVDVGWWSDRALVTWLEESAGGGELRARLVSADGVPGPAATVATTGVARAAGFPRLAIARDTAFVGWTDPGPQGGVRVTTLTLRSR